MCQHKLHSRWLWVSVCTRTHVFVFACACEYECDYGLVCLNVLVWETLFPTLFLNDVYVIYVTHFCKQKKISKARNLLYSQKIVFLFILQRKLWLLYKNTKKALIVSLNLFKNIIIKTIDEFPLLLWFFLINYFNYWYFCSQKWMMHCRFWGVSFFCVHKLQAHLLLTPYFMFLFTDNMAALLQEILKLNDTMAKIKEKQNGMVKLKEEMQPMADNIRAIKNRLPDPNNGNWV